MHFPGNYSGTALLCAAAMLLILPLKWVAAIICAAGFHEFCHYLAIRLCGGTVYRLNITHHGAVMETGALSEHQELFCALAGPAGSFLLFFCYPWIPRISLCALIQGVFNLLPVYPLDGGRAVRSLLHIFFLGQVGDKLCRIMEILLGVLIFACGCYCSLWLNMGIPPLVISLLLLFRVLSEKFLAKRVNSEYNSATKYN